MYMPAAGEKKVDIKLFQKNIFISFIIFALVLLVGGIFIPNIYQAMNIINSIRIVSIVGLVAIGETFVLLVGEIDISVGSIMSLTLVVGGLLLPLGAIPAILISLVLGAVLGAINGVAIAKGKINSLIMTLGTLSIYAGFALVAARGQAIYLYDYAHYLWLGKEYLFGLPVPVVFFIVIAILGFLFLTFTKKGKQIYYTGANNRAALCSGIKVENIKIIAFSAAGFLSALAGPFFASQTNRITPIQGVGFELSAIAIAVLGGTALSGGKGSVLGTVIGALTYGFLLNILSLSGIGTYLEQVLKGGLLIIIVLIFQNVQKEGV
jgi:ribose/xylose/arabinose/galactoside ABC-type transport system permease subunit